MFDPKLYRDACRELRASEEKMEEIIAMTEQNRSKRTRRPLRTALIAAAAVTMMVVSVAAANPEAAQEFWLNLRNAVQVDRRTGKRCLCSPFPTRGWRIVTAGPS